MWPPIFAAIAHCVRQKSFRALAILFTHGPAVGPRQAAGNLDVSVAISSVPTEKVGVTGASAAIQLPAILSELHACVG